jgi:pullulanase
MAGKSIFMILVVLSVKIVLSQSYFSAIERIQGYKITDAQPIFIFDEDIYKKNPERVIVEGSFRGWDHNLEDGKWWLSQIPQNKGLWILKSHVPIPPGSEFKFRIDNGVWLEPPENAPNLRGSNLVFAHTINPSQIRAEIVAARDIRLFWCGEQMSVNLDPNNYMLFDSHDEKISILKIFYIRPGEIQIFPAVDLDRRRVYYIDEMSHNLHALVSFDGWFRHMYSDKKLGAFYDARSGKTIFRIFAPRATQVFLFLYSSPKSQFYSRYALKIYTDGVWEIGLTGNLEGEYYDYTIHGSDDPGNNFYETNPVHITDPYAQVSVDSWGPARIWPEMEPPRPVKGGRPPMQDVIAYEVHVQDFTRLLLVPENEKGSFKAFAQRGLRNSLGESIGFDHIIDLGVNVVHLQPIQEFLHFPDSAWKATFGQDPYMIEQGINTENYQWGYRTTHALALESRYRTKGSDWGAQNQQFRDLVEAFHDEGIAVIVDVVFNHTGERMDHRMDFFNFSVLDKPYYYRTDQNLDYIGEYGTEIKSEERPMVQRWIYDQCLNLVNQYGVDGFRIDLAGQTDEQTLKELIRILPADIIVYGEPWIASADPKFESNPYWDWYKSDAPITFFQDESRNAFKGPPSNPVDKWKDRGYAGGNGDRENAKKALSAGFTDDDTPVDGINYLDIHDNWALADRFATENWDGRKGVDENRVKIAAALLFTSLGPVVIHGGTEFLRSKGHAPLKEVVKEFQGGPIYIHGKRDTYNLATANEFIWENKGKNAGDDNGNCKCNYKNMYEYWRGLIGLRTGPYGKVFRIKNKPPNDYYRWIEPENKFLLGYIVDNSVFVLINTGRSEGSFENIAVSDDITWKLVANNDFVNLSNGISESEYSRLMGGQSYKITLQPASLRIWIRE